MAQLSQLNSLYQHEGFKYLEDYIKREIEKSLRIIKTRTTPTREVDFARGEMKALEDLLDKVASDKQQYTSKQ